MQTFFLSLLIKKIYLSLSQNYASSNCGAYIFQSSKNIYHSNSILIPQNDYYLYGECKYSYITIKLGHEIKISKIEVQNLEWLSNFVSNVKISIMVDNAYFCLGTYKLKRTREKICIDVETKKFSSLLTFEFLDFEGGHKFFTITNIKVYGVSLFDEFLVIYHKVVNRKNGIKKEKGQNDAKVSKSVIASFKKNKKYKKKDNNFVLWTIVTGILAIHAILMIIKYRF
ncbi:hypothetical protein GVAV_001641 [Gurleya vavrai]